MQWLKVVSSRDQAVLGMQMYKTTVEVLIVLYYLDDECQYFNIHFAELLWLRYSE